jgi:DNA-binding response OmpR family regulator
MKRDAGRLVVLDESSSLRTAAVRALRDAGFDAQACGTVDEALGAAGGPPVALVLASSTLIAQSAQPFDRFLNLSRRPQVLFSCLQTRRCPLDPEVSCQYLGCLLKPNDFDPETLVSKVKAALA